MHRLLTGSLSLDRLTINIAGLPNSLNGCTIAQLSDLHYDGLRLSEDMLEAAIAQINCICPDLVVLTGDLVTDDPSPIDALSQRLQTLNSKFGVYACLGNHDNAIPGARQEITRSLTRAGINVLWNEIAYPFGDLLPLVGLADFWSKEFNPASVMSQLDDTIPRIVLSHNPDSAAQLKSWRVDLQLSGHTHGGQVVLPGLGPLPTFYQQVRRWVPKTVRPWVPYMNENCYKVVRYWQWAQGLHQVGGNLLYVNRGLGTYLPGRLFCPPEVTLVTLAAKPVSDLTVPVLEEIGV